jgi:aminobenzoyl-glutamate utilization protein B
MTGTQLLPAKVLGAAWPQHYNKPIAHALAANIAAVGMPQWDEKDQTLAKALQREMGVPDSGLRVRPDTLKPPLPLSQQYGGGSDDIGDVSWTLPTVSLRFPSNIPNLPGHHWANAIAMATPLAHKGATAGAKAMAMTMLDLLLVPSLVDSAKAYFAEQTKEQRYVPLIRESDQPETALNAEIMARYKPELKKFYYDPAKYPSYLAQLGISYPTVRGADGRCAGGE